MYQRCFDPRTCHVVSPPFQHPGPSLAKASIERNLLIMEVVESWQGAVHGDGKDDQGVTTFPH